MRGDDFASGDVQRRRRTAAINGVVVQFAVYRRVLNFTTLNVDHGALAETQDLLCTAAGDRTTLQRESSVAADGDNAAGT